MRIHMTRDYYMAVALFLSERYGLEVPQNWEKPYVRFAEDTDARYPHPQRGSYYWEGGSRSPDRFFLDWNPIKYGDEKDDRPL